MTLQIGFAEVEITPPVGARMGCFPHEGGMHNARRAVGVHDPLKAKALALSDGKTTVCLCVADVTLLHTRDVAEIKAAVARERGGLNPANLILAATHTHSSGESLYWFGGTPEDSWMIELRRKIAEVVRLAMERLTPATLSISQIEAPFNHNRRVVDPHGRLIDHCALEYKAGVTEGITDPTLTVLQFLKKDQAPVLWVSWTAHANTLGWGNHLFTADYPGTMSAWIEKALPGAQVLFSNGAVGNIHPKECMRADFEMCEKLGRLLGEKVLAAMKDTRTIDSSTLVLKSRILTFPNRLDARRTVPVEITSLKIGPLVVGCLPCDTYVEFQLDFRKALAPNIALMVGYANGFAGYLPTTEAFDQGGYGVDLSTRHPTEYTITMLPPGSGELILQSLLSLAQE